jgi:superfamily II DNA or RNA helicase
LISYRNIGNFYEVIFLGDNLIDFNKFHKAIKDTRKGFIYYEDTLAFKVAKNGLDQLLKTFPNAISISNEYDDIGDTMKLTPYLYQKEAIHYALKKQKALIILPCGSGKTPIGIGLCVEAYKQKLIKGKCLIVVKASLKYQWLKEVEKFSNLKAKIIETPTKAGKKKFPEQFKDCDVFIANYETLKNKDVVEKLLSSNIELIFCD